jgi:hypothetical protein
VPGAFGVAQFSFGLCERADREIKIIKYKHEEDKTTRNSLRRETNRSSARRTAKELLTFSSASITSMRFSRAAMRARCDCSGFVLLPFLGSGGADAFNFSIVAMYSSRVDEIVWNVAVIFQGFVDVYKRGESAKTKQQVRLE